MAFASPAQLGITPPSSDAAASADAGITLANTGTTESSTSLLDVGRVYAISNNTTAPIRVAFRSTVNTPTAVNAEDIVIGSYETYYFKTWMKNNGTDYGVRVVYVEAADGVAAYSARVYQANI